MESVELGVAFVSGAVVALDFEKKGLHFPERPGFDFGGDLFDGTGEFRFPSAEKSRQIIDVALGGSDLALRSNGTLQTANALVEIL